MSMIRGKENRMTLVWHGHHAEYLISAIPSLEKRITEIKETKDPAEQPTRLRLIRMVKGELPQEFIEIGEAYIQAGEAYVQAWEAYIQARGPYIQAWKAYIQAYRQYLPEIEALHAKECVPDCPWDGHTIFP